MSLQIKDRGNECAKECAAFYKNPSEATLGRLDNDDVNQTGLGSCAYCLYYNVGPASNGCTPCDDFITNTGGVGQLSKKDWCNMATCLVSNSGEKEDRYCRTARVAFTNGDNNFVNSFCQEDVNSLKRFRSSQFTCLPGNMTPGL